MQNAGMRENNPNTGKYGPEKLRIRTLFTQCYRQPISLSHYPLTSRVKLMCVTFLANIHILYPLKTPEKQRLPGKGYHCISSSSNRHNESPQIKLNLFMANIHI